MLSLSFDQRNTVTVLISASKGGLVMSHRTIVSLAASVIIGITFIGTISTDAFAYRRGVGVGRVGVHHGGVYRGGGFPGGGFTGVEAAPRESGGGDSAL